MPDEATKQRVTTILGQITRSIGSKDDLTSDLYQAAYAELRVLARRKLRQERPGHSLQTVDLVHEAYLRLVAGNHQTWENRAHFFGAASRAMMQVLHNHYTKRSAAKRGQGAIHLPLDSRLATGPDETWMEFATLSHLSEALSEVSERAARVLEMRLLAGMKQDEIAEALGVSRRTVVNDWSFVLYTAKEILDSAP